MENFAMRFNRISYLYKNFERLLRTKQPRKRTLEQFSSVALNFLSDSIDATLDALHELFIPTEIGHLNDGLLQLLAVNLETKWEDRYNNGPPATEELFLLYTALVTAEFRGFTMTSFTYILLEDLSSENYADDIADAKLKTLTRIQEYMWKMRDVADWTSNVYYQCDPPNGYERNVTFHEFENFLSAYIVNEYSLAKTCSGYCKGYNYTESSGELQCDSRDISCLESRKCGGQVRDCTEVQAKTRVCLEDSGTRRYAFMLRYGSYLYGDKDACRFRDRKSIDLSPFREGDECNYCLCTCAEDKLSFSNVYVFSLRPQLADITKNNVVVGVKFTVTPHVTHLQIQEAEVAFGEVDASTAEWRPLETMELDEDESNSANAPVFVEENKTQWTEGEDFARLTFDERQFYLDSLIAPSGYVVTGARLNRAADKKSILLEIHVTPFDFGAGTLIIKDDKPSKWITYEDMKNVLPQYYGQKRSPIPEHPDLIKFRSRITFKERTTRIPGTNYYMLAKLSNVRGDVMGTVYPLLDLRGVTGEPPFMLEGIGLIYKRPTELIEVGYLAFSLQAISRKNFLDVEVSLD